MTSRRLRSFTGLAALGATLTLQAGVGTPGAAHALPVAPVFPPAQVQNIESDTQYDDDTTPGGNVFYAVTAPTQAGEGYGWWLRVDVVVKNTGLAPITIETVTLDTDVTSPEDIDLDDAVTINAGKSKTLLVPSGIGEPEGVAPTSLSVYVHVNGYGLPVSRTEVLVPFESPTASGGYLFPGRSNDLPMGTFWSVGAHAHTTTQRYAYDFGARRWDSATDAWTGYTPTAVWAAAHGGPALGTQNDQWLIWNRPVYAIADATIVRCYRSIEDNVPGESISGGGNNVTLDLGDGTFVSYYHLKQWSVPAELCPFEGADGDDLTPLSIPVVARQYLGRVGNTGHSSGPHLHLQLTDSPSSDTGGQRGLPLRFTGIRVHASSGYDPETDASSWYVVGAAESGVPVNTLIKPPCVGACGFAPA